LIVVTWRSTRWPSSRSGSLAHLQIEKEAVEQARRQDQPDLPAARRDDRRQRRRRWGRRDDCLEGVCQLRAELLQRREHHLRRDLVRVEVEAAGFDRFRQPVERLLAHLKQRERVRVAARLDERHAGNDDDLRVLVEVLPRHAVHVDPAAA
jgi:hypothetical protein